MQLRHRDGPPLHDGHADRQHRPGRKAYLEWDGKAERFTNNEAANKLLSYGYRAPYALPKHT